MVSERKTTNQIQDTRFNDCDILALVPVSKVLPNTALLRVLAL